MLAPTVTQATPPSTVSSNLPPISLLVDEITALMVSHSTKKMTIANLTKKYNGTFRVKSNSPVSARQLADALKRLSNFKVNDVLISSSNTVAFFSCCAQQTKFFKLTI